MNEIMYIYTCSLLNIHLSEKFAFVIFFFLNYTKLLSNKGHYSNDRCQMMVLLNWLFKCNVAVYHLRGNHTVTLYEKREKIRYHLRVWPLG